MAPGQQGAVPDDENLETVYRANTIDVTGGMLDTNPELSICPDQNPTNDGQCTMDENDLSDFIVSSRSICVSIARMESKYSVNFCPSE